MITGSTSKITTGGGLTHGYILVWQAYLSARFTTVGHASW